MSDNETEHQVGQVANLLEAVQQLAQALTAIMQTVQPGEAQVAEAEAGPPQQPGRSVVMSDFQRKFGITHKPRWEDITSYSEELAKHNRDRRPVIFYPGFPTATDRAPRVAKTIYELHGKAQQYHLKTLLRESHARLQLQSIHRRLLDILPEDALALDYGGGLDVKGLIESVLDTNRDRIACLNRSLDELLCVVVHGEKLEVSELPHLTEEELEEIHLMAKKEKQRREANKRRQRGRRGGRTAQVDDQDDKQAGGNASCGRGATNQGRGANNKRRGKNTDGGKSQGGQSASASTGADESK